jgi:hypothetical protein
VLTLLLAAAVVAGYLTGRARPGRRAFRWADRQVYGRRETRRTSWRWYAAQAVYVLPAVVLLATRPRVTARAWRARNDPPPRSPAVTLVTPWPPEDPR